MGLKVYFHFCTVVLNHLALRILEVEGLGMVLRDSHYVETAVLQHSVETALASTDSECLAAFAVGDADGSILALLVVVVGAFVFVEEELGILAFIDVEVDEFSWFLVAPLDFWTEWDDGAFWHIDRNSLVRSFHFKCLSTSDVLACVEVLPTALLREIDFAGTCAIVTHWTCHERRTEHPLVRDVFHVLIAVEVHDEAAH